MRKPFSNFTSLLPVLTYPASAVCVKSCNVVDVSSRLLITDHGSKPFIEVPNVAVQYLNPAVLNRTMLRFFLAIYIHVRPIQSSAAVLYPSLSSRAASLVASLSTPTRAIWSSRSGASSDAHKVYGSLISSRLVLEGSDTASYKLFRGTQSLIIAVSHLNMVWLGKNALCVLGEKLMHVVILLELYRVKVALRRYGQLFHVIYSRSQIRWESYCLN